MFKVKIQHHRTGSDVLLLTDEGEELNISLGLEALESSMVLSMDGEPCLTIPEVEGKLDDIRIIQLITDEYEEVADIWLESVLPAIGGVIGIKAAIVESLRITAGYERERALANALRKSQNGKPVLRKR